MAILEKAYAKLHNCYENIDGGLARRSLTDCLGGFAKSVTQMQSPEVSGLAALVSFDVFQGEAVGADVPLDMIPVKNFAGNPP